MLLMLNLAMLVVVEKALVEAGVMVLEYEELC